ncbi:hypothetical protein G6F42_020863 [Rhizopus arrhizus]|nr:hypothetical protein G6F42_020863 [Rhizopus arrhizus]
MGIEIPLERVFIAQKMMITKCNLAGKPVICATQMLESMTYNPRPTRAEVSDVANAVLDGADCVMLSGETAKGNYPIEAVRTMHEICKLAETVLCYPAVFNELRSLTPLPTETTETVACAAVAAAHEQGCGAIIVLSQSGNSARLISKYSPHAPIIVVTRNPQTARQVHFYRGCFPFHYPRASSAAAARLSASASAHAHLSPADNAPWQEDVDDRIKWGMEQAMKYGLLKSGQPVVAVQGWKGGLGNTNTLRVIYSPANSPHSNDQWKISNRANTTQQLSLSRAQSPFSRIDRYKPKSPIIKESSAQNSPTHDNNELFYTPDSTQQHEIKPATTQQKPSRAAISNQDYIPWTWWSGYAFFLTCCIPNWALSTLGGKKTKLIQQAWREKHRPNRAHLEDRHQRLWKIIPVRHREYISSHTIQHHSLQRL